MLKFVCFFYGLFVLGTWPKGVFTNGDILRLHLACEVMQIDARQSIYYAAFNALGTNGVNTTMYVLVFACQLIQTQLPRVSFAML